MKSWLIRHLPASWVRQWRVLRNGRFTVLKWETDGLLPERAYERLYSTFLNAPDQDVVEIGGASGAASIAIALALKKRQARGRLVVVEKFEGGPRAKFGGHADNLDRFWSFLRLYEVAGYVRLWDGYLTESNVAEVRSLIGTPALAGLLMDADGRIHRDLNAFWDKITPQTRLFIDDVHPTLSTKHALTHRLVNRLIALGMIEEQDWVETTLVARRCAPPEAPFPWDDCQRIYVDFCREKNVRFDVEGILPAKES